MGSNSLMYYYNGKSVSSLFGNVCVLDREELEEVCVCVCVIVCLSLLVHLTVLSIILVFHLFEHKSTVFLCVWMHVPEAPLSISITSVKALWPYNLIIQVFCFKLGMLLYTPAVYKQVHILGNTLRKVMPC